MRIVKRESILLVIFAAILAWQCFLPAFIGLANNGDFGKMGGQVCIGEVENGAENFVYFVSDYLRDARFCWDSGMWSSELWFVRAASAMEHAVGGAHFDIRWIGALHALGFLGAFAAWMILIRPLEGYAWLLSAALLVLVLSDVSIVSYINTFYTDTPALIGAIAAVPLAAILARDGFSPARLMWFTAACVLLVTSKPSHALVAAIPALWLISRKKWPALAAGLVIVVASISTLALTPPWYKNNNFFTLVFFKLLPESPAQQRDAVELRIEPSEMKYVGMHAFMPGSPIEDPAWAPHWQERVNISTLVHFYLRHPSAVMRSLRHDLENETWQRRPVNLSNYRRSQGYPAGAKTWAFGWWSALRTALFQAWPWHIVVWYLAALGFGIARKSWLLPAVLLAGGIEFSAASLTDAAETYRHLLLFQIYTDLSLLLTAVTLVFRRST